MCFNMGNRAKPSTLNISWISAIMPCLCRGVKKNIIFFLIRRVRGGTSKMTNLRVKQKLKAYSKQKIQALDFPYLFCLYSL